MSEVIDVIQPWSVQELEFLYAYIYARLRRGQVTTLVFENVVESKENIPTPTSNNHPQDHQTHSSSEVAPLEVLPGVQSAAVLEATVTAEEEIETQTTSSTPLDEKKSEDEEKKTWAQMVATPTTLEETNNLTGSGGGASQKGQGKNKKSPETKPTPIAQETKNTEPLNVTGATWKNFCGSASCGCEYTFRDEDDPARTKRGAISGKTLFVRGWNRDDFEWTQVREAFGNALQGELRPLSTRVNTKGFAFLKFSSHKLATSAKKVLSEAKNFLSHSPSEGEEEGGVELIVNFAA